MHISSYEVVFVELNIKLWYALLVFGTRMTSNIRQEMIYNFDFVIVVLRLDISNG